MVIIDDIYLISVVFNFVRTSLMMFWFGPCIAFDDDGILWPYNLRFEISAFIH